MNGGVVRFRDLGPLLVESRGVARPVGGARLENALALLLIHAGRAVGIDALCDAVWGEQGPRRSASTLDSHVWRLRRVLEPERAAGERSSLVVRDPGGYRLVVEPDHADSLRFARLTDSAADLLTRDPVRALEVSEEARALWRGRPFGRSADQDWARAAVARLGEIHGRLREVHVEALIATGAGDRALAELETLIADEPLRERLWFHRITALCTAGRRSDAMAAYARARALLVDELGVEPGAELRALHAELLRDDAEPPPDRTGGSRPDTSDETLLRALPSPRSRLTGRDRELATLVERLVPGRLVTVVGAAGCGKTRLAVEVARAAASGHPDGVCFVDLTAASPGRVLDTVTSTLELAVAGAAAPADALRRFTATRRLLLVLDNCEHVLDDVADLVDDLLGARTAILATSREPLTVDGEDVVALDPLDANAGAELFLDRLLGTGPDESAVEPTVREIVAAVDGLPLALELAAGRARAYTLTEIAAQVRTNASSLSRVGRARGVSHHRTVFDAVDTSYRDLPADLAALHRAVGAVPGPFTVEAAAGLAGVAPAAAVDAVAGLVHRSLVTALGPGRTGGPSRFAQLATVRGHATHVSGRGGEDLVAARDRWVHGLVRARPPLGSRAQAEWFRALDDDLAALRATLQHTLVDLPTDENTAAGIGTAARLVLYWAFNGMAVEGLSWFEVAARHRTPTTGNPADRAMLQLALGCELLIRGRVPEGRERIRTGIGEGATGGLVGADAVALLEALAIVTGPLRVVGDGELLGEVAAAVARHMEGDGSDVLVQHTELFHALVADPGPELVPRLVTLHAGASAADNHYTAWSAAAGATRTLLGAGRAEEALPLARAALHASARAGLRDNIFVLELYGIALARVGDRLAALRVLSAAEAQHRGTGRPWPPSDTVADLLATLDAHLDSESAARARTEGGGATVAQLITM